MWAFRSTYLALVAVLTLPLPSQAGGIASSAATFDNLRAVRAKNMVQTVSSEDFTGPCKQGLQWAGKALPKGRGIASVESCGETSPTLPIQFTCRKGDRAIKVSVPLVQALPRGVRGPFPVSLYGQGNGMVDAQDQQIESQIRQFQAMRVDGPGKGRLAFAIDEADPLLQALAVGEEGYVSVIAHNLGFHLEGALEALTTMRLACGLPKLNVFYPTDMIEFKPEPL